MQSFRNIMLWLGVFTGVALAFVIVIYFSTSLFSSGVKTPIEKQLAAIRVEDPALAYSYTTQAFQEHTSLETFKKFIDAYSGLRNNKSIAYVDREISNDTAIVYGNLISRGGNQTPVRYHLKKVNRQWKIESMVINPDEDHQTIDQRSEKTTKTKTQTQTNKPANESTNKKVILSNYFEDPKYKFSMQYPADWQSSQPSRGVVIFRGANGTPSYDSSITLQTVERGRTRSVQQVVNEVKNLIATKATQMRVIDDGIIPEIQATGAGYYARYIVYSYTMDNIDYGALEVIYYKNPNRALYVFDFVSPAAQFTEDLHAAKLMADSFGGR